MTTSKKAFTLAETLITLVIVGLVFAILNPQVTVQNDKYKILCKAAYKNLKIAVGEVVAGTPNKTLDATFCTKAITTLNVLPGTNCTSIPDFTTTNNFSFSGLRGTYPLNVIVDLDGTNGKNTANIDQMTFTVKSDGEVIPTAAAAGYITCKVTMNSFMGSTQTNIKTKVLPPTTNWDSGTADTFLNGVASGVPGVLLSSTTYANAINLRDSVFTGTYAASLDLECK